MNYTLNKQLNGLLTSAGLTAQKNDLVLGFTNGRSESRADLSDAEASEMIQYLEKVIGGHSEASNKMRRRIISYAHQMHWHLADTQAVDIKRLNNWCEKYGYLHKPLNNYSYDELPKLVSQFKAVFADTLSKL